MSAWYDEFSPVGDGDVLRLLGRIPAACELDRAESRTVDDEDREYTVDIPLTGHSREKIVGDFGVPNDDGQAVPQGLVILAHGGGSSRHSYRNRYLAARLRMAGWATLRLDLLQEGERDIDADTGIVRFDVMRLASRLDAACAWAVRNGLPGVARTVLFGASTGAAAAAIVASERAELVSAVVARGGRVDLAGDALTRVRAPVLMVVGGADRETLELNRVSAQRLAGRSRLSVVRGAGHTFEEPGALGAVGERVVSWLGRLSRPPLSKRVRSAIVRWWGGDQRGPLKTGGFHRLMDASPRRTE